MVLFAPGRRNKVPRLVDNLVLVIVTENIVKVLTKDGDSPKDPKKGNGSFICGR